MKFLRTLFTQYRKYLVAAAVPVLPVAAYYLGVAPSISSGAVWYGFIVAEFGAFGVAGISNDPKPPAA